MEMHESFGPWIRSIDPTGNTEGLTNRWSGTVATVKALDVEVIDHLVRRHYGLNTMGEVGAEVFENAHKIANPFLEIDRAANELRLLASACLAVILDSDMDWSDHAAMAVMAADLDGRRDGQATINLRERARRRAAQSGEALRRRRPISTAMSNASGKFDFAEKLTAEGGLDDHETATVVLSDIAAKITMELTKVRREARNAVVALIEHIDMKDEELELLWWVFNEASETRDKAFKALKPAERGLVAGVELAKKLRLLPGPTSTPALLARMGVSAKTAHALTSAVDACDSDWIRTLNLVDVNALTPVHAALAERLRVGKTTKWAVGWSSVAQCDVELEFPEHGLAVQSYLEAVYLRSRADRQG